MVLLSIPAGLSAAASELPGFARVSYGGGGDWYNDPGILQNLHRYAQKRTGFPFDIQEPVVRLTDPDLAEHPFLYLTGHGDVRFSDEEISRLRAFLLGGGFLYADDDFGMDESFRREMKKVFPEKSFVELPKSHKLFSAWFDFPDGAPKIHKHHSGPPRVLALMEGPRILALYTFDTNISDGWADPEVHQDPPAAREAALKFGVNILMLPFLE
ncbi:DUF4159 domain-containing protein [bacterium]|nr:DUF4159 domain-containing protein [bacterium]